MVDMDRPWWIHDMHLPNMSRFFHLDDRIIVAILMSYFETYA